MLPSTGPDRVQLVMLPLYPFCVHAFAVIARNYLIAHSLSGVAAAVAAVLRSTNTPRQFTRYRTQSRLADADFSF